MFLLFQAAAQLPPIYVTVQQPAGGLPEWEKTLISAGIGALFGIFSSIGMEYAKPWIANRATRKNMVPLVHAEFTFDLGTIESAVRLLGEAEKESKYRRTLATVYSVTMANTLLFDRFDHFFMKEKALFAEMDEGMALSSFYRAAKGLVPISLEAPYDVRMKVFQMAAALGRRYIALAKLEFVPIRYIAEEAFREIIFQPPNPAGASAPIENSKPT